MLAVLERPFSRSTAKLNAGVSPSRPCHGGVDWRGELFCEDEADEDEEWDDPASAADERANDTWPEVVMVGCA